MQQAIDYGSYTPRYARASVTTRLLFASGSTERHITHFILILFLLQKEVTCRPGSQFSTCGYNATHIPKGNLLFFYFVPNVRFFRKSSRFLVRFLLRGPQRGGVDNTGQGLAPAGILDTCSRRSQSHDPASISGDGAPLPKSQPGAWKHTRIFVLLDANVLSFSPLAATATAQGASRVRAARANARAVRSGQTTATTGVRVLLECRWLLQSARVNVTAWPFRAYVLLVLVALEHRSDRSPVSFSCGAIG